MNSKISVHDTSLRSLKFVNGALAAAIVVASVGLVAGRPKPLLTVDPLRASKISQPSSWTDDSLDWAVWRIAAGKKVQERPAGRDLFALQTWEVKESPDPAAAPMLSSAQWSANLRLVGILLGENAQAVVEDIQERQTHFLHAGDEFRDARVIAIEKDRLRLTWHGQEIVLVQ